MTAMDKYAQQVTTDFKPFHSRGDYVRGRNQALMAGAGAALAGGGLAYLLQRKQKDRKKRIRNALLVGLGLGGATGLGVGLRNHYRWVNKYRGTGRIPYGYTMFGSGSFDPNSKVPVVLDDNGNPTISIGVRGIQGHIDTGSSNATFNDPHVNRNLSEQVNGAIAYSRHLGNYLKRVQQASDEYAASHNGIRPSIRLYGHSMGGAAALRMQKRLNSMGLGVDGVVGLDPVTFFDPTAASSRANGSFRAVVRATPANIVDRGLAAAPQAPYDTNNADQVTSTAVGHTDTEQMFRDAIDYMMYRRSILSDPGPNPATPPPKAGGPYAMRFAYG